MQNSKISKFQIIKTTCIGGVFFLIPLGLILIMGGKIAHLLNPIAKILASKLNHQSLLGLSTVYIVTILLVLIVCFIAGLLAKTKTAKQIISWLDDHVLCNIPGYTFMKKTNENIYGLNQSKEYDVILVKDDEAWQLAFLIEHIDELNSIVYIPGVPNPWSGELKFVLKNNIKDIDIGYKETLACIHKLGEGSGSYFKGKF